VIPARKRRWLGALLERDAERRVRRAFGRVSVRGLDELRAVAAASPVLVVSNHTAWWDSLVAIWLCRLLAVDAYAMMDARNLERLPFLGGVGAFGVDLADPADGARAIRYAAKLLRSPGRLVWVFPQGEEVPITAPALKFRPGAAEVARVARGARVVPVALRYEIGREPLPELWVSLGAPLDVERDAGRGRSAQEDAVARELAVLDAAILGGTRDGFVALHTRGPGLADVLAQAALAFLVRPRRLAR